MMRFLAFLMLLLTAPGWVGAEPVPEYTMKATYLYNFALYTEWPGSAGDEIHLCIMGEDRFGDALQRINGKIVNGRPLVVKPAGAADEVRNCHMLFLGESEARNAQKILKEIGDMPVLTVTEGVIPLYSGVIITMVLEDQRLVFRVNASAARKAKLNISSKLLRLASSVY